MGTASLVGPEISKGRLLLERLDELGLPIVGAYWLFTSDPEVWMLHLVTPLVDEIGPRRTYRKIQDAMKSDPDVKISLRSIKVVEPSNDVFSSLSSKIRTGPGITDLVLSGNTLNNLFIEEVYIYRVNPGTNEKKSR